MLNFKDITANIDEPRTARMEQRTMRRVKAQIQQAAALLGVDDTTFIASVALERARATIADHERTVLSAEDREAILAALDSPPAPTDHLREVMALHSNHVESSVRGRSQSPTGMPGRIEPFDPKRHDRSTFGCGTNRLDNFL